MAQIGQPVAGGARVERDVFGVSVVFPQQLGGIETPYWPTVRFGAGGELESANGYLGSFDDAGPYPRIGTDAAFALLASGRAQPWLPATSLPVESALPVPGGEPTVVRIVGVAEGLWAVFGVDGSTWLVPSYVFSDAEGGEYPVLAIPEELIEVEETAILPQPAEGPATSSVQ